MGIVDRFSTYKSGDLVKISKEIFDDIPFEFKPRGTFGRPEGYKGVSKVVELGELVSNLGVVGLLEVELDDDRHIENHVKYLNRSITSYMSEAGGLKRILVAFYKPGVDMWRLSFVLKDTDVEVTRGSEVVYGIKLVSHILGEEVRTGSFRDLVATSMEESTLDDKFARLMVNEVEDRFFKEYKSTYFRLVEIVEGQLGAGGVDPYMYVQRLLGQTMFIYFIQKKGWLGVGAEEEYGEGDKNFIRNLYKRAEREGANFHHDYLEPLYYEGLGSNRGGDEYFDEFGCKIPFLNGGLFDSLDGYDYKSQGITLENEVFSNSDNTGVLDIFDRYNFTVTENSDDDVVVGVDPEMLGNVFESLMDSDSRSETGAVYTPKNVVDYMCKESLVKSLENNFPDVSGLDIKDIVYSGDLVVDMCLLSEDDLGILDKYTVESLEDMYNYIKGVKIAEPSVGSGAFLVGMLRLLKDTRRVLVDLIDLYGCDVPEYDEYYDKLDIITNNLYGVDLNKSAVEIAKLRLWLSLVVESDEPIKLPNLDFKLRVGDSLVDEFRGVKLGVSNLEGQVKDIRNKINDIDLGDLQGRKDFITKGRELEKYLDSYKLLLNETVRLSKEYTISHDKHRKLELKRNIENVELMLGEMMLELSGNSEYVEEFRAMLENDERSFFLWDSYFYDVYVEGGFDIVIGNPPYKSINDDERAWYRNCITSRFSSLEGQFDLLGAFIELSRVIAKELGWASFILSDKWLRSSWAKKLRESISYEIQKIVYLDAEVFENVKVDPVIIEMYVGYEGGSGAITCEKLDEVWTVDADEFVEGREHGDGGKTLEDLGVEVKVGVETGLDVAFILSKEEYDRVEWNEEELTHIYKISSGRCLDGSDGRRVILLNKGWSKEEGVTSESEFEAKMPNIHERLSRYKDYRGKGKGLLKRNAQGDFWWESKYTKSGIEERLRDRVAVPMTSMELYGEKVGGTISLATVIDIYYEGDKGLGYVYNTVNSEEAKLYDEKAVKCKLGSRGRKRTAPEIRGIPCS